MLLDRHEPFFFNANFKEAASAAGWAAYRGELILKEGEIADAQGRRKLTGARREELAGLQWDDVDFQWKSLTIRDKVEGERTIPLTPYAAILIASLPRRTMERDSKTISNPWVFSSPTAESGRLQEPRIQHNKALAAAGLPALSIHGLRRSFGTLAEWVECPTGIAAQIMGHKPSATAEKHYRHRPLDLLRLWHTKIA